MPNQAQNGPQRAAFGRSEIVEFGRFTLRRRQRELLADGRPIELGCRAFEVLLALIDAGGALVTKAELLEQVWPNVAVEENNLHVQICAIRRVFGGDRNLIQTVAGRGYRFAGTVRSQAELCDDTVTTPRLSIIVLPFVNLDTDGTANAIAEGITDTLTTDISRALPGSVVISRARALACGNRGIDGRSLWHELGARYAVTGSVLVDADRVRVNAHLTDTATDTQLWADRFDKERQDVLSLQDEIAACLSRAASLRIIEAEARESERAAAPNAIDFIIRGQAALNRVRTPGSLIAARGFFEEALRFDPSNGDALAGVAITLILEVLNGYYDAGRAERLMRGDEIITEVLASDPNHFLALKARAALLRARGWFDEAIAANETVIARSPSEPWPYEEIGLCYLYLGDPAEAITWFQKASRIGPLDPSRWVWLNGLGRAQMFLGREAKAVQSLRCAVTANPKACFTRACLAAACALNGCEAEAKAALRACERLRPGLTLQALSRAWSVPLEATPRRYREYHERLMLGLRRAGMPEGVEAPQSAAISAGSGR